MEDTLIKKDLVKTDIHIFKLPRSLVSLDGITDKDAVTIIFKNGELKSVDINFKNSTEVNARNSWHVNKAIITVIEELKKEY